MGAGLLPTMAGTTLRHDSGHLLLLPAGPACQVMAASYEGGRCYTTSIVLGFRNALASCPQSLTCCCASRGAGSVHTVANDSSFGGVRRLSLTYDKYRTMVFEL